MPVTYHQRTFIDDVEDDDDDNADDNDTNSLRPHDTESIPDQDPDDAIVLSDLVRTGEASRLRRRGAMRLDNHHAHAHTHTYYQQQQRSPTVIMVAEPTWESDSDEQPASSSSSSLQYFQRRPLHPQPTRSSVVGARNRLSRRYAYDEGLDFSYVLFCGGEEEEEEMENYSDDDTPFAPSPFPNMLTPQTSLRRHTSCSQQQRSPRRKRTNGCGALIHLNAAPRPRSPPASLSSSTNTSSSISTSSTWVAHRAASTAVVPVEDPIYLEGYPGLLPSSSNSSRRLKSHLHQHPQQRRRQQQQQPRPGCGCVREAVACVVCGNILGRRFRGCKANMGSGLNASVGHQQQHQQRQKEEDDKSFGCPEGMRYWREGARHRRHSSRSEEGEDEYMYTFLASAVSSSPSCVFPTCTSAATSTPSRISTSTTAITGVETPSQPTTIMSSLPTALPHPSPSEQRARSNSGRSPSPDRAQTRDRGNSTTEHDIRSVSDLVAPLPTPGRWSDLDRLITTASPTPLSDEEREVYRSRVPVDVRARYSVGYPGGGGGGGRYRAPGGAGLVYYTDAEFIVGDNDNDDSESSDGESLDGEADVDEEPGSPEKTGDVMILNR